MSGYLSEVRSITTSKYKLKFYIRNMVCIRCKIVVKDEIERLGLHPIRVELGQAEIVENLSADVLKRFRLALLKSGLELMDDKKSMLIEKIKTVIVNLVHYKDEPLEIKFSEYLSQQLGLDYTYLANLFSEVQGMTIEHYLIAHKIEKVKEVLVYDEISLTEIAYRMHYSSVAHLSYQFKKVTGLTPSHFKKLKDKKRKSLEEVATGVYHL